MNTTARDWPRRIDAARAAAWRRDGAWRDEPVSRAARAIARIDPDRVTHVSGELRLTASLLVAQAERLATSLHARGLRSGDVVSFQLPNWHEAVVIDLAASMLGLVVNPIVPIYRDAEVELILDDCGAKAIFLPSTFRGYDYAAMLARIRPRLPGLALVCGVRVDGDVPALAEADRFERLVDASVPRHQGPEPDPDAVKMIMYTSGTTGRPKGVLHSHNTLQRAIRECARHWGIASGDAFLMASPVTHVTGFSYGIEMPFLCGTRTVFMDRWVPADAVALIDAEQVAGTCSATPFLQELLDEAQRAGRRLPSLRAFACGGAAVPPELIRRTSTVLANCRAFRVYGSSEAPVVTLGFLGDGEGELAASTDGRIVDYEVRVVDDAGRAVPQGTEGEICARGPALMLAYADAGQTAESFDDDGFFHSGDIGFVTADRAIVITGRKKDLINRGGEKVSAKEIEDLLHAHPSVREAAIVSMPHPRLGETVCAYVIPREGRTMSLDDVTAAMTAAGVARQKFPEKLVVVDDLPRTASGKVKKDLLRVDIRDRLAREPGVGAG